MWDCLSPCISSKGIIPMIPVDTCMHECFLPIQREKWSINQSINQSTNTSLCRLSDKTVVFKLESTKLISHVTTDWINAYWQWRLIVLQGFQKCLRSVIQDVVWKPDLNQTVSLVDLVNAVPLHPRYARAEMHQRTQLTKTRQRLSA